MAEISTSHIMSQDALCQKWTPWARLQVALSNVMSCPTSHWRFPENIIP